MDYYHQAPGYSAQDVGQQKMDLQAYIAASLQEAGVAGMCFYYPSEQQQQQQQHTNHQHLAGVAYAQHKQAASPSPFSCLDTQQQQLHHHHHHHHHHHQLHEQGRPLCRSSWPGVGGQLQQQCSTDVEPELSLGSMVSSSWSDGGLLLSSRLSCSTLSSTGSSHQLLPSLLQQHQQQHLQQHKMQPHHHHPQGGPHCQQQQQQPASLQLQAARSASFSLCSPCCSTASEFGDFACCRSIDGGSSTALSSLAALSAAGGSSTAQCSSSCGCSTRAGSSNSNSSSVTQGAHASPQALCHSGPGGGGLCSSPPGGGACCLADAAAAGSAPGAVGLDEEEEGEQLQPHELCRSESACSLWSLQSSHVASRPAPGGLLGAGISWVMPRYGGREVLAEYEFGPTLGCGTFGVTRLVTHRRTARPWACKTICKASIASSPAAQSDVQHEVAILRHLRGHPGIVQLRGVYEDERSIHLVMELCTGGDLLDYISRFGRLTEDEAADVTSVMLSTLAHCHSLGVVHRDIKPENFLLGAPSLQSAPAGTAAGVLKVSDFGVSAFLQAGEHFTEIVGTPFYMAPEVLERCYGQPSDVWSAGVVAYLMLAGRLPFDGATDRQIIKAVLDSEPDFDGPAWDGVSAAARDCVGRMLVKDPARRASIEQLLDHPWLAARARSSCCAGGKGVGGGGRPCRFCGGSGGQAGEQQQLEQQQQQQQQHDSGASGKQGVSWASPCVSALEAAVHGG